MTTNPFSKYLRKEDILHSQCCGILRLYPNLLWHHSPNEGKRSSYERFLMAKLGTKAGFPDLAIYNPCTLDGVHYVGMAIELKSVLYVTKKGVVRVNVTTDNQKMWLTRLGELGWYCKVIHEFNEFERTIKNGYGK